MVIIGIIWCILFAAVYFGGNMLIDKANKGKKKHGEQLREYVHERLMFNVLTISFFATTALSVIVGIAMGIRYPTGTPATELDKYVYQIQKEMVNEYIPQIVLLLISVCVVAYFVLRIIKYRRLVKEYKESEKVTERKKRVTAKQVKGKIVSSSIIITLVVALTLVIVISEAIEYMDNSRDVDEKSIMFYEGDVEIRMESFWEGLLDSRRDMVDYEYHMTIETDGKRISFWITDKTFRENDLRVGTNQLELIYSQHGELLLDIINPKKEK